MSATVTTTYDDSGQMIDQTLVIDRPPPGWWSWRAFLGSLVAGFFLIGNVL